MQRNVALLNKSTDSTRVFLGPGDLRFYVPRAGQGTAGKLHTLLGSCVSIVLWHPERGLGGMSHCILPERAGRALLSPADGRYCDGAAELFRKEVIRAGTMPPQYQVYLVGGARMYLTRGAQEELAIGRRNVETARAHLRAMGFLIRAESVEGEGHRKVELDLSSGAVTVMVDNKKILLSSN